jgi:hypothetical protein
MNFISERFKSKYVSGRSFPEQRDMFYVRILVFLFHRDTFIIVIIIIVIIIIIIIIIIIMAVQPFVAHWPLFQFLYPIHSRQDSLVGGSARHKASTYTQNNTNRINTQYRHPYLEWDTNPRSRHPSERRPETARPL